MFFYKRWNGEQKKRQKAQKAALPVSPVELIEQNDDNQDAEYNIKIAYAFSIFWRTTKTLL